MELLKSIKNSSFIIKRFVANSILALRDAGTKAKLTFSLLIMTIVGGAVDPVIMGYIADTTGSMAIAFLIPLVCYGVIGTYALLNRHVPLLPKGAFQKTPSMVFAPRSVPPFPGDRNLPYP